MKNKIWVFFQTKNNWTLVSVDQVPNPVGFIEADFTFYEMLLDICHNSQPCALRSSVWGREEGQIPNTKEETLNAGSLEASVLHQLKRDFYHHHCFHWRRRRRLVSNKITNKRTARESWASVLPSDRKNWKRVFPSVGTFLVSGKHRWDEPLNMGLLPLDQFLCWKLKVATIATAIYVVVSTYSFMFSSTIWNASSEEQETRLK